jgi:hypothetical protein
VRPVQPWDQLQWSNGELKVVIPWGQK